MIFSKSQKLAFTGWWQNSLAFCLLSLHPPAKLDFQKSHSLFKQNPDEGPRSMHQLSSPAKFTWCCQILAYIPLIRPGTRDTRSCKGSWEMQSLFWAAVCPAQKSIMMKNRNNTMVNNQESYIWGQSQVILRFLQQNNLPFQNLFHSTRRFYFKVESL